MSEPDNPSPAMVDTNVIVYAYDTADLRKHHLAKALLRSLSEAGRLIFSAQVLNEFSSVLMNRKRDRPLSPSEVSTILLRLLMLGKVIPLTSAMTLRALDAIPRHGFSSWDALVWAAAREQGAGVLFTEDFQHGRDVEGVRIVNPFESEAS